MVFRQGRVLATASVVLTVAVAATGCGQSADERAREAFTSAVRDVGPHSHSIREYCREHIAMSTGDCLDVFANAAAYCPWPDNHMPTILKSWAGNGGRTLRVRGRYRGGTSYTRDVVVVTYRGHLRLAYPYWLDSHSQPPCPAS